MKKLFLLGGSRLLSALRLALAAVLLLPLAALPVYVNYTVDCQGYFRGDTELREVAMTLFAGNAIIGFEQLKDQERMILDVIVANTDEETMPETVAFGSSRILQLTQEIVGTSFYNSGTTGGDFYDLLSTFFIYDKREKLPRNVIIGVDPWLFNTDPDAQDKRSERNLYAEFLTEKLGIPTEYEHSDPAQTWKFLFDLSYFQGNLEYLSSGASPGGAIEVVPAGQLYEQDTEVKCPDGSLLYGTSYRARAQEEIDMDCMIQTGSMFRLEEYFAPDAQRLRIFEAWIRYMQEQGINVIFLLAPYPPIVYDHAVENAERYGGMLGTETAVRRLGKQYGIPVYGSYNPHAIPATGEDFYDGLHPRRACIGRIFPGVPQALADRDAGVDVSLDPNTPAPQPAPEEDG